MSERRNGIALGISTPQSQAKEGDPLVVYIWLSNESFNKEALALGIWLWNEDHDFYYGGCCESTFLDWLKVSDARGVPLSSALELRERKIREEGREPVRSCTCSTEIRLFHPGFCGVLDGGTLNRPDTAYKLALGKYTVILAEQGSVSHFQPKDSLIKAANLTITITK